MILGCVGKWAIHPSQIEHALEIYSPKPEDVARARKLEKAYAEAEAQGLGAINVDGIMDWFNSNFYRDWGYGLIYPQLFPHLKREDAKVQEAVVAYGKEKSKIWLQILNDHYIGSNKYLCGNQLTVADYFGAAITTAGELVHCDFSAYPNIKRWLDTFKAGPNYAKVYETFNGFCASTKGQPWQAIT